jgi:hypothetical protein
MTRRLISAVSLGALSCLTLFTSSHAEIPQVISYQGRVTDTGGTPVPDGTYSFRLSIYDAPTGGTSLWYSGTVTAQVTDGVFSVLLGESPQPAIDLPFDEDYWLNVWIEGNTQTPRQRLCSAGYAFMASRSDTANIATGLVPGIEVSGAVTTDPDAAIKGTNTATSGFHHGISGESASTNGCGVYGYASATSGGSRGVYGTSSSPNGIGVYGIASRTVGGVSYGGKFEAASENGNGVCGLATATSGQTYGVYGKAESTSGRGVHGYASATTGSTYGGFFQSSSQSGTGVYGYAYPISGVNYGVRGETNSDSGYGGHFTGRLYAETSINADATPGNHVAQIYNDAAGTSPDVLSLKVGYVGNPGTAINYITFFRGDDAAVGAIEGDGGGGVTYKSGSADFAEFLPKLNAGESMNPGDVVGVFDGKASRRTLGASQHLVISARPIVLGNAPGDEEADTYARVAFIGQVDVNVSGEVRAGDLLIPSGLGDGTAIAISGNEITAEQFRSVVGQAWESSMDPGVKKIRASVGLQNHNPTVTRMAETIRDLRNQLVDLEARLETLEAQAGVQ